MSIDPPSDLLARIVARTDIANGIDVAFVIKEALDTLEFCEEEELSEAELQESLARIDQGMDDARHGRWKSLDDAMDSIRRQAGLE